MDDVINFLFCDEFTGYNLRKHRRPRIIKPRINYVELFDEIDFNRRFRISKNNFIMLLERIENQIRQNTDQNDAIPPIIQLLVALRFYATGSFLQTIGDFCGISTSSAQRIVHRVSCAIAALREEFIKLPLLPEEIRRNQEEFYHAAKFIRIIGSMDCTHIKIQSCGTFGDSVTVADSGYPNLPYIMCPLQYPTTAAEHLYNESQIRTRSKIERFFGIWKKRFPVLYIGTHFHTPEKILPIIVATAILHNIIQQDKEEIRTNPEAYNNAIALMQNIDNTDESVRYVTDVRRTIVEYFER